VQVEKTVSGHHFSDAAKDRNSGTAYSLLKKRHCRPKAPSAAEAEIDFVALVARLEAAPFQSKIKSEIFQQTVQPLGLARHGTAAKACVL